MRPRVICHMMASVDGRIVTGGWPDLGEGRAEYERTAAVYEAEAWLCGRITMEPFAGTMRDGDEIAREAKAPRPDPRADFVAPGARPSYAIAVDPGGRLLWRTNEIGGDHVVAVLSERVSDAYLAHLEARGVSYLFAGATVTEADGATDLDLSIALDKVAALFGVRTLLLEGGGRINGAMLREGLVDEVSLLIAPVADGTPGVPSVFDVDGRDRIRPSPPAAWSLSLEAAEKRAAGVVWLRYRVRRGSR